MTTLKQIFIEIYGEILGIKLYDMSLKPYQRWLQQKQKELGESVYIFKRHAYDVHNGRVEMLNELLEDLK